MFAPRRQRMLSRLPIPAPPRRIAPFMARAAGSTKSATLAIFEITDAAVEAVFSGSADIMFATLP